MAILAAQSHVDTHRFDSYKNFKFRVKWDGRYVAGVSKVTGLKRTTEVVKHRDGGDPSTSRKSPGRTDYEAITLERGVTYDREFEQWANKVRDYGPGLVSEVSLEDFRRNITVRAAGWAGRPGPACAGGCWAAPGRRHRAQPLSDEVTAPRVTA